MEKLDGKYAWTVTVGTKGQIVIPKEAREIFGIQPGASAVAADLSCQKFVNLCQALFGFRISELKTYAVNYRLKFRHIFFI